jgi:hypothetical protein
LITIGIFPFEPFAITVRAMQRFFLGVVRALALLTLLKPTIPAFSQEGSISPAVDPATPRLEVDDYRHLDYRIEPSIVGVTAASIEVWDRPQLLSRINVPIKSHGRVEWRGGVDRTPDQLYVALIDPDAPLGSCTDNCNYSEEQWAALRRETSRYDLMVGVGPEGEWESPTLDPAFFRVPVGDSDHSFLLDGRYFTASTTIRLLEENPSTGMWYWGDYCQTELIDPWQIRVTVPASSFTSGHRLALTIADRVGEEMAEVRYLSQENEKVIVTVACLGSPVLDSVEPSKLFDAGELTSGVPVKLRGEGFSQHSTVSIGDWSFENSGSIPQFVSSQELQIMVDSYDRIRAMNEGEVLRVWVKDAKDSCLLSESKTIQVSPTVKPRGYPEAKILTALPYPVPLMDAYSPELMELQIIGEHFRPNVTAVAHIEDHKSEMKLNTEFISSKELRVQLPRELWRSHRLSYRFVISTSAGDKAVEIVEPD